MSITTAPGRRPAATPSAFSSTERTILLVGSMVITKSEASPRARSEAATRAPVSAAHFDACAGRASAICTVKPALTRLDAMGQPMAPTPTNPIFAFMG